MEPLRFTMDSQWIPSHSRSVVLCSFAFPVSFAPCAPRTLRDTEPLRFSISSRWDPQYLSCTFTVFPVIFPLIFFLCPTWVSPGFWFILWYCLMSFVYCTTISRTTNKHKKRILHKEKTSRHKSIKLRFCLFVFFLHVKFSLSMYYACSSFAYLSFTKVCLLALVIVNQKAKKALPFWASALWIQYTLYSAGKRSFPCFEFVVQPH